MKNNIFDILKMFLTFIFVTFLIILFVILFVNLYDNKLINNIEDFTKSGTKILYISNKENYSEYSIELLDKYEVDYLYIDSTSLSGFEKTKIKEIIGSKEINNTLVIFKNGKIIDILKNYLSEQNIIEFFQKYNIVPTIIGNPSGIIEETKQSLSSDMVMMYLPYQYSETIFE